MSFSIVTGLNPRAVHDATYASTQAAWNTPGSDVTTDSAPANTRPEISRKPDRSTLHTFFAPEEPR